MGEEKTERDVLNDKYLAQQANLDEMELRLLAAMTHFYLALLFGRKGGKINAME